MNNYINKKYYKSEITATIIGCAQKVHQYLGNGFQEVIYQRALEIEFEKNRLKFEREKEMDIFYEDRLIGNRRVDFLVDEDIMVELKAITKLEDVNIAQLINYIEAYKVKIGLLLNFGAKSLEVKRYIK
jgi:GxxExxY protein